MHERIGLHIIEFLSQLLVGFTVVVLGCVHAAVVSDHLLRLEMLVAQRQSDDKAGAGSLTVVAGRDRTVVKFHERTGEVEADARTRVALSHAGRTLIEALEDRLKLVLRYAASRVAHGDDSVGVGMCQADVHLTARGGELKGIGEQVHDHLVEVVAVHPHRQRVAVVVEGETYLLDVGLLLEELHLVVDESYHVGFPHVHGHLSLVDFPEVHHLVDEVKDTLGIAAHERIGVLPLWVAVGLDEREQRGDDQGERRADVVADVDEEPKLGLTHLFGMDMLLEREMLLLLALAVGKVGVECPNQQPEIDKLGRPGGVPCGTDLDLEFLLGRRLTVVECLDTELVFSGGQMGEGQHILSLSQCLPSFVVDAVGVGHLLHIVIGERGQLQREAVVVLCQGEQM